MAEIILGKVKGDTGEQGIPGVPGEQGIPGEKGDPAIVNGKTPIDGAITLSAADILNGETSVAEQINNLGVKRSNPYFIAHRGFSSLAPENTLASLKKAIEYGTFKGVEFDIQLSSDGHFVVIHDDTVDRTTNGTGLVNSKTLAQLQSLDAGSWFGGIAGTTDYSWEIGSIGALGNETVNDTRIRTTDFIFVPAGTIFSLADFTNKSFYIWTYNKHTNEAIEFLGGAWQSSSQVVPYDCNVRIGLRYNDDRVLTGSDIPILSENIITYADGIEGFVGEKIPTLEEYFEMCYIGGLTPYVEIKATITELQAQAIVDLIDKFNTRRNVSIQSFDLPNLTKIRVISSEIPLAYHAPITIENINAVKTLGNARLSSGYASIDSTSMDLAKANNIDIECYTVDVKEDALALFKLGVIGINSNSLYDIKSLDAKGNILRQQIEILRQEVDLLNVGEPDTSLENWKTPTLLNSWANFSAEPNEATCQYYKDRNRVYIKGTIKDGTPAQSTPVFVLPEGYRPTGILNFATYCSSGISRITIAPNGDMYIRIGSTSWNSLDGISFRTT